MSQAFEVAGATVAGVGAMPEDRDQAARRAWHTIATLFFSNEVHDAFHAACEAAKLPHPGALKMLLMLEPGEEPSMSSLARTMNCDASYVTGLVDALEAQRYVERTVSPTDRRVKLVRLTRPGIAAAAGAVERLSVPPPAMDRLTDTQVRTLAQLVGRLADPTPRPPEARRTGQRRAAGSGERPLVR